MSPMYTRDGKPLMVSDDMLFAPSGTQVARIVGDRAFGPDGSYVGTVVGNRLIYRSTDSAAISSPFSPLIWSPFSLGYQAGVAYWGDEPPIRD